MIDKDIEELKIHIEENKASTKNNLLTKEKDIEILKVQHKTQLSIIDKQIELKKLELKLDVINKKSDNK